MDIEPLTATDRMETVPVADAAGPRIAGGARIAVALFAALLATASLVTAAGAQQTPTSVVDAVRDDAASQTDVDEADISLFRTQEVTWNDRCLGAPADDEACAEALTEGYVIWVQADDEALRYHTNVDGSEIRLAARGLTPGEALLSDLPDAAVEDGATDGPDEGVYTVQPGDTLFGLAIRFHAPISVLVAVNDLEDPDLILAGQRLVIPVQDAEVDLTQACEADAYAVDYPEGWATNSGSTTDACRYFDPDSFTVPDSTEFTRAVNLRIDNVAFDDVIASLGDNSTIIDGGPASVDGRTAVYAHRVLETTTLYPEGTEVYGYLVDLGDDGTLIAVTYALEDFDFERNRRVMDSMIATLTFE